MNDTLTLDTICAVLSDAEGIGLIDGETREEIEELFYVRAFSDKALSKLAKKTKRETKEIGMEEKQ